VIDLFLFFYLVNLPFTLFQGINNTMIYNQLEKSMAEKSVALEVLSYHATCSKNELVAFLSKYPNCETIMQVNSSINTQVLSSYVFDDFLFNADEMVLASYAMFAELNFIENFKIEKQVR
jgi:dual 3',5'-cyclic-AMP and -GMP phosphodiesterase 11